MTRDKFKKMLPPTSKNNLTGVFDVLVVIGYQLCDIELANADRNVNLETVLRIEADIASIRAEQVELHTLLTTQDAAKGAT